jgi:HPt (histidine-containing phosphotransfer) domain-containing protein
MAMNATGTPACERVFDPSRLSGLSQLLDYEDEPFREMAATFCDAAAASLACARGEAARGDHAALARTAHAMVDAATLIGAERMASAAAALRAAALDGRFDLATGLMVQLTRAFAATRAALEYTGGGRRES